MRRVLLPLILGFASMLPFLLLELRNGSPGSVPLVLFGTLWLLGAAFLALLLPILRRPRPRAILLRVTLSLVVASVWARIVLDQMPCFLGVPNCD